MKDLFSVKGKTVVITGGSRGIGLMMARGFVENGARVYITSRKVEACQKAAAELNSDWRNMYCDSLRSVQGRRGKGICCGIKTAGTEAGCPDQ